MGKLGRWVGWCKRRRGYPLAPPLARRAPDRNRTANGPACDDARNRAPSDHRRPARRRRGGGGALPRLSDAGARRVHRRGRVLRHFRLRHRAQLSGSDGGRSDPGPDLLRAARPSAGARLPGAAGGGDGCGGGPAQPARPGELWHQPGRPGALCAEHRLLADRRLLHQAAHQAAAAHLEPRRRGAVLPLLSAHRLAARLAAAPDMVGLRAARARHAGGGADAGADQPEDDLLSAAVPRVGIPGRCVRGAAVRAGRLPRSDDRSRWFLGGGDSSSAGRPRSSSPASPGESARSFPVHRRFSPSPARLRCAWGR